ADRNRSHWSTSKTPSYTKSVSWQHHLKIFHNDGTATEFNRFSQFASFSSSSAPSVTAPFRAELSANPAETVVEGPFSKDVILKITYN
ncbi:hypothetical protein RNO76_10245, partial [Escherichia coli]|nr:hypothetical protein [Escherichia coli]